MKQLAGHENRPGQLGNTGQIVLNTCDEVSMTQTTCHVNCWFLGTVWKSLQNGLAFFGKVAITIQNLVKLTVSGWMRLLWSRWNSERNSQQRQNDEQRKIVAQIASGSRPCGNGTSSEASRKFETSSTSCPSTSRYNWLDQDRSDKPEVQTHPYQV